MKQENSFPAAPVTKDQPAQAKPSGTQPKPRRAGRPRRTGRIILASFLIACVLPSLIGAIYYAAVATDRYAARASFVVRQMHGSAGGTDMLSSLTGVTASGSTNSDSYIIRRFLEGPDLVRKLDEEFDLRGHFSAPEIDLVSRFDNTLPFEELVEYWNRRLTTSYDNSTGILTFEVQAFDETRALELADAVLSAATELVNDLSIAARKDSVSFAQQEVTRAEERLRAAQLALREFRSESGAVDPVMNVQLDAQLIGNLEAQQAELQTRIRTLRTEMDENGPVLRQMRREEEALTAEIQRRRSLVSETGGSGDGGANAAALTRFENLTIDQTFAQQLYASALTSLETARIEASRQQRYLATFERPYLPEDALYPLRLRDALLIAFAALLLWAIGTLLTLAIRDHLR